MKKTSTLIAAAVAAVILSASASHAAVPFVAAVDVQVSAPIVEANYYDPYRGVCVDNYGYTYYCRRGPVVVVPFPGRYWGPGYRGHGPYVYPGHGGYGGGVHRGHR